MNKDWALTQFSNDLEIFSSVAIICLDHECITENL